MGWWDGAQCSSAACIEADYYNLILDKGEEAWNCLFGVETGGPFASLPRAVADDTEICADHINLVRGYIEQMTDVECPECDWPELEDPCPDSRDVVGRSDPGDPDAVCICDYFCLEEALDCIVETCCGSAPSGCPSLCPDSPDTFCNYCDPAIPQHLCVTFPATLGGYFAPFAGKTYTVEKSTMGCTWQKLIEPNPCNPYGWVTRIFVRWIGGDHWEVILTATAYSGDCSKDWDNWITWDKPGNTPCDPTGSYSMSGCEDVADCHDAIGPEDCPTYRASCATSSGNAVVTIGPLNCYTYRVPEVGNLFVWNWHLLCEDDDSCVHCLEAGEEHLHTDPGLPEEFEVTLPVGLRGLFAPWSGRTFTVCHDMGCLWRATLSGGEYGATLMLALHPNITTYGWSVALIVHGFCGPAAWKFNPAYWKSGAPDYPAFHVNKGNMVWDWDDYVLYEPCDPTGGIPVAACWENGCSSSLSCDEWGLLGSACVST